MSRVGKKPIAIPEKTEVTVSGNILTVKGPQGTLTRPINADLKIDIQAGKEVTITPNNELPETGIMWGTVSSHLKNMLEGVVKPFEKRLLIEGVGYKWDIKGDKLTLNLGFSHQIVLTIPKEVKAVIEKGVFVASSIDKDILGQFVAQVRSLRKPEPYKGKGIRYENEVIRRKEGKKTT